MSVLLSSDAAIRILVLGTPRSGNTWLRALLATAIGAESYAVHHPGELASVAMPSRLVVQIHWDARDTSGWLAEWQIVTVVRHPLDVLISVLHLAQFTGRTALWLVGNGGNEESLVGCSPNDEAVLQYASSDRFLGLLDVSGVARSVGAAVRYEELVGDTIGAVRRALADLGLPDVDPEGAVRALDFKARHDQSPVHNPRGRVGGWKSFLTKMTADRLAEVLKPFLEDGRYSVDADPELDAVSASARWRAELVGVGVSPLLDPVARVDSVVAYARALADDLARCSQSGTAPLPAGLRVAAQPRAAGSSVNSCHAHP